MNKTCVFLVICILGVIQMSASAQMEKRATGLYNVEAFNAMKPRVGELAPDFELVTLEGEAVSLSSFHGSPLIVIKGGFT